MKLSRLFHLKKKRRFPIQRDHQGRSLRGRCFERFALGRRPAEVAEELNAKEPTVQRYFQDWQKLDPNFAREYAFVKELFKKTNPECDKNYELFARTLGITKEQLETILSQSHGLRRLITGKLYFPVQSEADHKKHVALQLAMVMAEHLLHGGQFEDLYLSIQRYIKENMISRQKEEDAIQSRNQIMPLIHKVLEIEMRKEREGRIIPDTLSERERQIVMKLEVVEVMKETEMVYWIRIVRLMAEGYTVEQAREKVYQDLVAKGDLKGAKFMREFQDKIHPLKEKGHSPPVSPTQPPSG